MDIELMKKIFLLIVAAFAVCAVSLTSCNNKPPFVRLAAAIDSLNVKYGTDERSVSYEEWENVVNFHKTYPGVIDGDAFAPIAANIRERLLENLVVNNEYGIVTEIIDAHANVRIDIEGLNNTKYVVEIENKEISEAYDAAKVAEKEHNILEDRANEVAQEGVEPLSEGQIEQELLEGNAPSIAEEENDAR